jgi:ATP-dependent Clp protease adapter protein ClpS
MNLLQTKYTITTKLKQYHSPMYKVILYNDKVNEIEYVHKVLVNVFNDMRKKEAIEKTWQAHNKGSSILRIYPQDIAEESCEKLRLNNLISQIEPV